MSSVICQHRRRSSNTPTRCGIHTPSFVARRTSGVILGLAPLCTMPGHRAAHLQEVRQLGVAVGDMGATTARLFRQRLDHAAQAGQRSVDLLRLVQSVARCVRLLLPLAACRMCSVTASKISRDHSIPPDLSHRRCPLFAAETGQLSQCRNAYLTASIVRGQCMGRRAKASCCVSTCVPLSIELKSVS